MSKDHDHQHHHPKIAPVLRTITSGVSLSIESEGNGGASGATGGSNRESLLSYRAKDTRRNSVVIDKNIAKRRLSQAKIEFTGQQTQESVEDECI